MRHILHIFLLTFFVFAAQDSKASHLMGGDIEVEHLDSQNYIVQFTVQYDCHSHITFPPFSYYLLLTSTSGNCFNFNAGLELPLYNETDITPVCKNQCTVCDTSCATFDHGINSYTYRDTFDLSNDIDSACCNYDFSLAGPNACCTSNCCRNEAIDNIEDPGSSDFRVEATVNTCLDPKTPEYTRDPVTIICKDQLTTYNQGVKHDPDEEVHFRFADPYEVDWKAPFTKEEPLSFDDSAGFNLDSTTGDLSFIPDSQMTALMAIEAVQMENDTDTISITKREMQIVVIDCDNETPELNADFSNKVCVNDSINIPVTATDPDSGYIWLEWDEAIDGPQFNNQSDSFSVTSNFTWVPDSQDVGQNIFSIEAKDDGCPLSREASRAITVDVSSMPDATINGQNTACVQSIKTYSTPEDTSLNNTWQVSGGSITEDDGNQVNVEWNNKDTGIVKLTQEYNDPELNCSYTDSIIVEIHPLPDTTISGPASVCAYSDGHVYAVDYDEEYSYSWNVNGGDITANNDSSITVTWNESSGDGTVTVTQIDSSTQENCEVTASKSVEIQPRPDPDISLPPAVCEYSSGYTFSTSSQSDHSYYWTSDAGSLMTLADSHAISVSYDNASAGTDSLSLTQTNDTTGCDTTVALEVIIHEKPDPVVNGPQEVCEHTDSHQFSTSYEQGSSYSWSTEKGTISEGNTNDTVTISYMHASSGTDTITLTQTIDSTGCDSTVKHTVSIHPKPDPSISGPQDVCEYTKGHVFSTSHLSDHSYSWNTNVGSITEGSDSHAVEISYINTSFITDQISVTKTNDSTGCDTTVTHPVSINEKPTPDISGPDKVCEYTEEHTFSAPSASGYSYAWSAQEGVITDGANTHEATISYQNTAATTDSITVTQTNETTGCDSTVSHQVSINEKPRPSVSGPDQTCESTGGHDFIASSTEEGHSYNWHTKNGVITEGQGTDTITVSYMNSAAGTDTITLTQMVDSTGCDSTVTHAVAVNAKPTPSISGPDQVCDYTEGHVFSTPEVSDQSYQWTTTHGTISSGENANEVTISYSGVQTNTDNISLTQTNDSTGCDSTITHTVQVYEKPTPEISGPSDLCAFTGDYTFSTNAYTGHSYNWSTEKGIITSGDGTESITVSYLNASGGTDTLTLTQTIDSSGCDSTYTHAVTIHENPGPKISGPAEVCAYTSDHTFSTDAVTGHSYQWTSEEGTIQSGEESESITVSYDQVIVGKDTIKLTQTNNATGCDTTVIHPVSINEKPTPDISGPDKVCEYTEEHTFSAPSASGYSYSWSAQEGVITDGANTHEATISYQNTAATTDSITVTQTNETTGCDSMVAQEVIVHGKPEPEIIGASEICEHSDEHTFSVSFMDNHDYVWNASEGGIVDGQNSHEVTVNYLDASSGMERIELMQTDGATGCDSIVTHNIEIHENPSPEITGPAEVCEYSGEHTFTTYSVSEHNYAWSSESGVITSGGADNEVVLDFTNASAGTDEITLTQTNTTTGCDTTLTKEVTIEEIPEIFIDAQANGPFCLEDLEPLNGATSTTGEGTGEWSGPGVVDDSLFDASLVGRGTHKLTYIFTMDNGCQDSAHTEVSVALEPQKVELYNVSVEEDFEKVYIEWRQGADEEYIDAYMLFRDSPENPLDHFQTIDDVGNINYLDKLPEEPGGHLCYYLRSRNICDEESALSNKGCVVLPESSSEELVNTVTWKPYENWPVSIESHSIGRVTDDGLPVIIDDLAADTTSYEDDLSEEGGPAEEYCYFIESHSVDGRMSRSALTCTEQPALVYLPNSFSPNTPFTNEVFGPDGLHIENYEMTLYNRWGQIVYETEEGEPWDGTFANGEKASEGNYLYIIKVYGKDGQPEIHKGVVTILG